MRKFKTLTLLLLCSFGLLNLCFSPADAQANPNAPTPGASAPPQHPFESLLEKLDHPPVNLASLADSQKRSELLRSAAAEYDSTMKPVLPVLKAIASNKDLEKVRYVPAVGTGQDTIGLAASMGDAMHHLIVLDRDYVKPLQIAAAASLKLRKSRSMHDVPEAAADYTRAAIALSGYSNACKDQSSKLGRYAAYLDKLAGSMPGPKFVSAPVRSGANGLRSVAVKLTNIQTSLDGLQAYNASCAADGNAALLKNHK